MVKNNFQYGGWNFYTVNVARSWHWFRHAGDCTLQCGMWLWNHDSEFIKWHHPAMSYVALGWHAIEFARWQHPAMWHVGLGLRHWVCQVAASCNVAGGSEMTCHWIRQNVPILEFYIWFRFWPYHCSRHVILHQSAKFYLNRTTLGRKKWRHVDFQDGGSQPCWMSGVL